MVEWRCTHINAILFLNFLEVSKKKKSGRVLYRYSGQIVQVTCHHRYSGKHPPHQKKQKKLLFFPDSVNILLLTSRDIVNQLVFNLELAV